ncbi:alpha-hydroxy acid oxidase [Halomonas sp. LS-001]
MEPVCIEDWELLAKRRLPAEVYDFIAGGAGSEQSLRENIHALKRVKFISRVLRGVCRVDSLTTRLAPILGEGCPVPPLLVAPSAHHKLVHPEGELATITAANQAGIPFVLSTMSDISLEAVCEHSVTPVMFQFYLYKDRQFSRDIMQRAQDSGCSAFVFTVDVPLMGARLRDRRNRFEVSKYRNESYFQAKTRHQRTQVIEASGVESFVAEKLESTICWADVEWIKSHSNIPLILKGISHPLDAEIALQHEVDALYLSNHGGRQLDHHVSAISMLPHIRQRLGSAIPIIVDGGIRSGTDVLKALALGADAVGVGRPALWGLAAEGTQGVTRILEQLIEDLELSMHLCGCSSLAEINNEIIWTE